MAKPLVCYYWNATIITVELVEGLYTKSTELFYKVYNMAWYL